MVGAAVGSGIRSARLVRIVKLLAVSSLTSASVMPCGEDDLALTSSIEAFGFLNWICQTVPPV